MTKKPSKKSSRLDSSTTKSPTKQSLYFQSIKESKKCSFHSINLNLSDNLINRNHRFGRTISFININRMRATKFCTLKHVTQSRRFSLGNNVRKINIITSSAHPHNYKKFQPFPRQALPKQNQTATKIYASDTLKRLRNMKQRIQQQQTLDSLQQLKKQTIYLNVDQRLKEYIENQANSSQLNVQNEELNNKIDLEIRILDGILKLLNAICSANPTVQSSSQPGLSSLSQGSTGVNGLNSGAVSSFASATLSSFTNMSPASVLINNLEISSTDDVNKCNLMGAEIAAAIMSNKATSESGSVSSSSLSSNSSSSSPTNSVGSVSSDQSDFNQIYQILSACKCLYVSHRKISIYLQNLQELENKQINKKKHLSSSDILAFIDTGSVSLEMSSSTNEDENSVPKSATMGATLKKAIIAQSKQMQPKNAPLSKINFNGHTSMKKVDAPVKLNHDILSIATTKLMLKDLRIPLSWKYNDHIKALKNSENINQKFAAFAIIHLGNMIYDTQLISNIDPTVTEICFNETFIFDDVKQNDFLITIELYSYELFNTASNLIQSARKLAKQLTDFASFKKANINGSTLQQQHQMSQSSGVQSNQSTNHILPINNYSYSMHKFKLIAKSYLTHKDLSDQMETRCLEIVNEPNRAVKHSDSDLINRTVNANNLASLTANTNKLPLFDYYSCCLCVCPTSTFI